MSISYQFDYLPSNVLTLSNYDFFQFIKNTLGETEVRLSAKLSVRTTSSFILIDNPLDVFNEDIEDEELDKLKEQMCFKTKNNKFLIKPGVLSGFRSLKQALKDELSQQQKHPKKKKQQQSSAYVLKLIKKWCYENKENFDLQLFELEEDTDFTLNMYVDHNSTIQGTIKCKCGKVITLSKNDEKVQVSNYYKHLQSTGCSVMKEILKKAKEIKLIKQQQQSMIPVSRPALSQPNTSSIQLLDNEQTAEQRTSHNSSTSSVQPTYSAKRRITSQSQQYSSTKRSRT
ncbi:unnamed protein product [Rotaria sp. Silwood2]|nr:unnamed protein product [Rotaria sp. Silwood2]CAF4572124.1 unnamed protein product [Rotaria sp. Silwood2]